MFQPWLAYGLILWPPAPRIGIGRFGSMGIHIWNGERNVFMFSCRLCYQYRFEYGALEGKRSQVLGKPIINGKAQGNTYVTWFYIRLARMWQNYS